MNMFSSNGAFKTTGLLHAKIHPIVMLFILIVKYCACLYVVYLLMMTTPCHGMDPPALQHLGGTSRCCYSTASTVNGQLLQSSWQMGLKALISLVLKAQHPDLLWVVIYSILPMTVVQLVLESTHLVHISPIWLQGYYERPC